MCVIQIRRICLQSTSRGRNERSGLEGMKTKRWGEFGQPRSGLGCDTWGGGLDTDAPKFGMRSDRYRLINCFSYCAL